MNLKKLDLNLLVVFEAVYSAANISHAAARLGMSQPAVSGALTRLRDLLKDPLFVPTQRGVQATVKAQRMIAPVREALGIIKAQLNDGQIFDVRACKRHFRLLLTDALEPVVMPPLIRRIAAEAPGITVELVGATPNFAEEIRSGAIDAACFTYPNNAADIVTVPINADEPVLIARRGHPGLGKTLDLATFSALAHVALVPELRALTLVDRDLQARQITRRIAYAGNKLWSMPAMVERTDLVGIVANWYAHRLTANFDIEVHALPVTLTPHISYLMWHTTNENDRAHRWLRETMLEAIRTDIHRAETVSQREPKAAPTTRPRKPRSVKGR